ncbi:hypothetical protein HYC85_002870 [Camellia sinensis]|uniref:Uncharacterized protein n=1 Tax=Camellia sinensis TaxID=4442 RepID=A0A7J7IAR8_CAMSI|nr:hypothetical protein HYC85_002870 [Camellia sinensis]
MRKEAHWQSLNYSLWLVELSTSKMSGEKKVQELHNSSTDEGPNCRGSVRGLGFGALPSKVDAQVHQNEHVRKLKGKVLDLEQQLDEIRAMLIKERRQNDVNEVGLLLKALKL